MGKKRYFVFLSNRRDRETNPTSSVKGSGAEHSAQHHCLSRSVSTTSRGARSARADARLCTSSGINLIVSLSFQVSTTLGPLPYKGEEHSLSGLREIWLKICIRYAWKYRYHYRFVTWWAYSWLYIVKQRLGHSDPYGLSTNKKATRNIQCDTVRRKIIPKLTFYFRVLVCP